MTPLALIRARAGSKGLPGKHLRLVCGLPVIGHVIRTAQPDISRVLVSTNDQEIAGVAAEFGAEIIERPDEFSQDASRFCDGVFHALRVLRRDRTFDVVVQLEGATLHVAPMVVRRSASLPTAPISRALNHHTTPPIPAHRSASHPTPDVPVSIIRRALNQLDQCTADSVLSIVPAREKHPDWAVECGASGRIQYRSEWLPAYRQGLRTAFHVSGACRCSWRAALERAAAHDQPGRWWTALIVFALSWNVWSCVRVRSDRRLVARIICHQRQSSAWLPAYPAYGSGLFGISEVAPHCDHRTCHSRVSGPRRQ